MSHDNQLVACRSEFVSMPEHGVADSSGHVKVPRHAEVRILRSMALRRLTVLAILAACAIGQPMEDKARYLQRDLKEKHLLDGLYVSIVPATAPGEKLTHSVDEPGNVIHAGVWTGRYLGGVAYQYAVTRDRDVRIHGGALLAGLRRLQEVTGKPGLLARGYVKGHGPVELFERGGGDSAHWHQGQGQFSDYRFYSDVSVDNFNAVLYGYALYYDLAADDAQKKIIAFDVDRLMTHLLDNHYRIVDLNGQVTQFGHVGIDPDPARDGYYLKLYANQIARYSTGPGWRPSLRASLMALPDLLIAYHITGKQRYRDEYRKVIERFAGNPEPARDTRPYSLERVAKVNHSSEGQAYEALFNLIRYEDDPKLLEIYNRWVSDLWEMNWMEGNSLYTFMTLALLPRKWEPTKPGKMRPIATDLPHAEESLQLAVDTLRRYPMDRVLHPVMNSIRPDIELNPTVDRGREKQAAKPVPIDQRPLDNEYAWKGNPYALDGWLKPSVTAIAFSCDDPLVAWFSDATGRAYMTRDGMKTWRDISWGLEGARVRNLVSSPARTFVLFADTDRGVMVTRDGGMSWRSVDSVENPEFPVVARQPSSQDVGAMEGWRIPVASWVLAASRGTFAGGPGGAYQTSDGKHWSELKLWREDETGAADYLHAYWMGRYYGFVP